jgi:hypothetical protein
MLATFLSFLDVAGKPLHFSHCRDSLQFFNLLYCVHRHCKCFISLHSVGDFKAFIAAFAKNLMFSSPWCNLALWLTLATHFHYMAECNTLTHLSLSGCATHWHVSVCPDVQHIDMSQLSGCTTHWCVSACLDVQHIDMSQLSGCASHWHISAVRMCNTLTCLSCPDV